jgi:hypothetical protein
VFIFTAEAQRTQRESNFLIGVDLPSLKLGQGREDANEKISAASQQDLINTLNFQFKDNFKLDLNGTVLSIFL